MRVTFCILLGLLLPLAARAGDAAITFSSDDQALVKGFAWAKRQAMAYVFRGNDPVGPWYEAALPGREAFCMRDVSHQLVGAQLLGLADINKNLLSKFAGAVAPSRDWCGYWEINKWNQPAPVDYKNDADFWYNLPANFDVIDACYRAWLWTADSTYLTAPVFTNFYAKSLNEYVRRWDPDGDGLMEGTSGDPSRRGLSSYNEEQFGRVGVDLLAGQYIANLRFSEMLKLRGQPALEKEYVRRANRIRSIINKDWWVPGQNLYHHYIKYDGTWLDDKQMMAFLLRWNVVPSERAPFVVDHLISVLPRTGVEMVSYLPLEVYRYGKADDARQLLLKLVAPDLKRREYPEVSYAALEAFAVGLMGVQPDPASRTICTVSRLTGETQWAQLERVPLWGGEVSLRHEGRHHSQLTNETGGIVTWEARFYGRSSKFSVNGKTRKGQPGRDEVGRAATSVKVPLRPGETCSVVLHD